MLQGILNPTVLKRYTAVWKAHEFHAAAIPFYENLEKTLAVPMWHALPIYRIFSTAAEQNAWMVAAGQKVLQNFFGTPTGDYFTFNSPPCPLWIWTSTAGRTLGSSFTCSGNKRSFRPELHQRQLRLRSITVGGQ